MPSILLPRAAFLHVADIWTARNVNGAEVPEVARHSPARMTRPHHEDSRFRYCTNFIVTGQGLDGFEVRHPHPQRADHSPAPDHRPDAHHEGGGHDDPLPVPAELRGVA